MSASTHGFLDKEITGRQVFDVIVSKFDKDAKFDIKISKYDNKECGSIYFQNGENYRSLFYCITGDKEEETEYANGRDHVCLILEVWNNSAQIMTEIVKVFGGYVDENDCDDIEAYFIPKDNDFQYEEYVKERNNIIKVLTKDLSESDKIKMATEILKHKIELKSLL